MTTSMPSRLWQYQRERFPLRAHGPLIVLFSASAVSTGVLLWDAEIPALRAWIAATTCVLLQFLAMRIADEFKDAEKDLTYRPTRPVPRGLVTLRELALVCLAIGAIQLWLVLWLAPTLLMMLLLVWGFFALTWVEFGCGAMLERRPLWYMLSHLPALALLYAFAMSWAHPGDALALTPGAVWGLALAFLSGTGFEIARKVRAPADEQAGVETYTAAWGLSRAMAAWLVAFLLAAAAATQLAAHLGVLGPVVVVMAALSVVAVWCAWGFVHRATRARARAIEALSAVSMLLAFAMLGPLPLLWEVV